MNEPLRWVDDPESPDEFAQLLRSARRDGPTDREIERLGARLASTPLPQPAWRRPRYLVPLMLGALGALGIGWQLTRHPDSVPTPPRSSNPAPMAATSTPAGSLSAPAPTPPVTDDAAPSTSQPSTPPPGTAQLSPPLSSPLSEVELLRRARDLLERDPNGTLRWVERHRAQYPHGKLEQEREVLAVEALRRLGRDSEAARRAGAFVSEHPESAHKTRLERTPTSESPPPASTH